MNTKLTLKGKTKGMGWLPDYPDFRDYTLEHKAIKPMADAMRVASPAKKGNVELQKHVDQRQWCSPIEDQEDIGSCTANAGVGLVEYYERRAFGKHIDASRLFLYKVTRNLLRLTGDTGAFLRTTMGALVLFGVPPEEYWPYTTQEPYYDQEPPAFCYSFAQAYQAIKYVRLDPVWTPRDELLDRIKTSLAAGLPSIFGFDVFSAAIEQSTYGGGKIPYPCEGEKFLGGHAVMAVGYDDKLEIENSACENLSTVGAILIRNSWSEEWGDNGYGWLPYEYVLKGLAVDWWTLLSQEWVDTHEFGL
jgi:C1A family cysteine protease